MVNSLMKTNCDNIDKPYPYRQTYFSKVLYIYRMIQKTQSNFVELLLLLTTGH